MSESPASDADINDANGSRAEAAQEKTNNPSAFSASDDWEISLDLDFISTYSPDANGDLQYFSSDIKLTLGLGNIYTFTLSVPP